MRFKLQFACFVLLIFNGCKQCPKCFSPPEPFHLKLLNDKGENLLSNGRFTSDSITIYYIDNGNKQILTLVFSDFMNNGMTISSTDIPWLSASSTDKHYYLQPGKTMIDTLYIDVSMRHTECCTYYTYDKVSFRDKTIPFVTNFATYELTIP
jgi:hypothetical protein